MSKLTDKIEALIQWNADKGIPGGRAVPDLTSILAGVREMEVERDEWQQEHQRLADALHVRNAENKQAYDNGFRVASEQLWRESETVDTAIRAAKREAYEHAQHLVQYGDDKGSAPYQAIQDAIDALDVEGVVK